VFRDARRRSSMQSARFMQALYQGVDAARDSVAISGHRLCGAVCRDVQKLVRSIQPADSLALGQPLSPHGASASPRCLDWQGGTVHVARYGIPRNCRLELWCQTAKLSGTSTQRFRELGAAPPMSRARPAREATLASSSTASVAALTSSGEISVP
jgi:hypothetical protein